MKVTVKILKGGECTHEVREQETVLGLKSLVAQELGVPTSQQRLVYKGKTLLDEKTLQDSGVTPGSKIFLMLKKAEDEDPSVKALRQQRAASMDFWKDLLAFLQRHFQPDDAQRVLEEFRKEFETNMASLSLDDIERIATNNIGQRAGCTH